MHVLSVERIARKQEIMALVLFKSQNLKGNKKFSENIVKMIISNEKDKHL